VRDDISQCTQLEQCRPESADCGVKCRDRQLRHRRKIAGRFPAQGVLYFADRTNFPYGSKSRVELLAVMQTTIERVMKRIAVLVGRRPVDCEPRNQGLRRTRGSTIRFFDPADDVVEAVAPYVITGSGTFPTLVSGRQGYDLADFRRMLEHLGLDLAIELG
jgi:hypothetical protein